MIDYNKEALQAAERGIRQWAKEEILDRRQQLHVGAALVGVDVRNVEITDVSEWPLPEKGKQTVEDIQAQIAAIRQAEQYAIERIQKIRQGNPQ
jgi:hypothetical protein